MIFLMFHRHFTSVAPQAINLAFTPFRQGSVLPRGKIPKDHQFGNQLKIRTHWNYFIESKPTFCWGLTQFRKVGVKTWEIKLTLIFISSFEVLLRRKRWKVGSNVLHIKVSILSVLLPSRWGTRLNEWGTQWDTNSLSQVCLSSLLTITLPEVTLSVLLVKLANHYTTRGSLVRIASQAC